MCIRDSSSLSQQEGSPLQEFGQDLADGDYLGAAEELSTICLLYTSDAADDLLCVDLGGRRTIKQKILTNLLKLSTIYD